MFAALTWILGNLIRNPVSWVPIPVIVAIVLTYRERLRPEKLAEPRQRLDDLDRQL